MTYHIRVATAADVAPILVLFPRLAAFELPSQRSPEDLWQGDAELLQRWSTGAVPQCLVYVAESSNQAILGVAIAQLRPELLSHMPSAHLEVLVVGDGAEGQGIGKALINIVEQAVWERGAGSMTLHVFRTNSRARALYERLGYLGELIRYIKYLPGDSAK
ncbi:MAG: GNAT family N-acetyltransferase [Roseiflexaceae bacterium]|nr:GNAT family N-acetyltransferase [Roseiflexaceae bacterium]